jgi:hypothetical protein
VARAGLCVVGLCSRLRAVCGLGAGTNKLGAHNEVQKLPGGGVFGCAALVLVSAVFVAGRLSPSGPKTGACAWSGVS